MGDWNPGAVRLTPGELEPDVDEGRKHRRQVQWGKRLVLPQGFNRTQFVSLLDDDPNAVVRTFAVTCSRNLLAPLPPNPQPIWWIMAGTGGVYFDWQPLAPGTYILTAQSIAVYAVAPAIGGAMDLQAWAALSNAAPTLVLP